MSSGREEVGRCLRATRLVVEYIEILIKHYQQIDIVINTKTISKNYKIFGSQTEGEKKVHSLNLRLTTNNAKGPLFVPFLLFSSGFMDE